MQDYDQHQLASGSTLTQQQIDGFLLLLRQLASYRNRNSRNIGEQFRQVPAADKVPEWYSKEDLRRKTLDMVADSLNARAYVDASQVYSDIYWTFRSVAETAGKSNVIHRDALKMETVLDELWTKNKILPPLSSLDSNVRPLPRSMSMDAMGDDSMSMGNSARPSPIPQSGPDHHYGSMSPAPVVPVAAATTATAIPSIPVHRPTQSFSFPAPQRSINSPTPVQSPASVTAFAHSSSVLQQPLHMPSPSTTSHATQVNPLLQRAVQQQQPQSAHSQYVQQMHYQNPMSIFYPFPSGDQGIEIPLQLPPSILSNEAKQRLQDEQDEILSARAKLFKGKKRKREVDEVADESSGWLEPRETGSAQKKFYLEVIGRLKAEKEAETGRSLSAPINNLPSQEKFPQFYQCIRDPHPPTLSSVEKHIRTNLVPDPSDFDAELCTIFANGRIWPAVGMNSSDGEALPPFYGDTICLQRLYQEMTKGKGSIPNAEIDIASLASVPYGPGSIPLESHEVTEGQTRLKISMSSNRIPVSQKTFLESVHYKGEDYAAGDFIHLFNPSNPRLPIIAQIFKCYRKNETGDRYLTVNWYYRPCQTSHPEDRTFYEQEVFKTSLFIDHKLEDLIERVSVMHISDFTKGRFDYWDEDMPLYVVEHRWNIETNSFSKIKNWQLCIPEDSAPDPLSFRPFLDTSLPPLNRIKSPFFRDAGITGPGQPGDSLVYEADDQLPYYQPLKNWPEGTGGLTGYAKKMLTKKLADPIVPSQHADTREHETGTTAAQKKAKQNKMDSPSAGDDAADGQLSKLSFNPTTEVEQAAKVEQFDPLPVEIKSHFRSDPKTGELLWFSAPPLEIEHGFRKKTPHSLEYLAHLARKLGY